MLQASRLLCSCSCVLTWYALCRQSFAAAVAVFAVPYRVQVRSQRSKIRLALAHTAKMMLLVVGSCAGGAVATEQCANSPTTTGAQRLEYDMLTLACADTLASVDQIINHSCPRFVAKQLTWHKHTDRKESDPGATKTVGRRGPFSVCSLSLC